MPHLDRLDLPHRLAAEELTGFPTEQRRVAIRMAAALAVAMPRPATLLAILAALFAVGRLCFALGYARGAAARAFGFALTFYPSLAALVLAIGWTLTG